MKPYLEGKVKEALSRAAETIDRLRATNERLAVKADAFDAFASMMHLLNRQGGIDRYHGVDAAHILRTLLAEIEAAEKPDQAETKYDRYPPNRRVDVERLNHDLDGFDDEDAGPDSYRKPAMPKREDDEFIRPE